MRFSILRLRGLLSGSASIKPAATSVDADFVLPSTKPATNSRLTVSADGVMGYEPIPVGAEQITYSSTPPANPAQGSLWWETDANGNRLRPWPWQRFGVNWASQEVQRIQRVGRDINGNVTLGLDDAAVWPGEFGKLITRVEWSFLRHLTNANVSTWRAQLLIRTADGSNNAASDLNPINGTFSPSESIRVSTTQNFGWVEQTRLIAINVFRLTGTGQMDLLMSADVRAWRT